MQKKAIRGAPLPHQVHYYSNVGDRLPVLGDEERETRQTFQELVQLAHTCNVLLRRAIWSVDPTVFNPQYNLQVRLPLTRLTNQPSIQRPCQFRTSKQMADSKTHPIAAHPCPPPSTLTPHPLPCARHRCGWTRSTRRWDSWRARRGSTSPTPPSSRSPSARNPKPETLHPKP